MIGTPGVNLAAPGPIGDTTPSTVKATVVTATSTSTQAILRYSTTKRLEFTIDSGGTLFINQVSDATRAIAFQSNGSTMFDLTPNICQADGNARFQINGVSLASGSVQYAVYNTFNGIGNAGVADNVAIVTTGVDRVTVNASTMTLTSGIALKLGNAAVTGLSAGVLAASTNASITVQDSNGTTYRIPCIV